MSTTTAKRRDVEPELCPPRETTPSHSNGSPKPTPPSKPTERKQPQRRSKLWWGILTLLSVLLIGGGGYLTSLQFAKANQELVLYTVERSDLSIIVTERGTIESQENVQVFCEVDDIDGDGVRGTPLLSIVPNGSSVEEGQLIVEFESTAHQELLDRQILDHENAVAAQIQAKAKYDNQITQNKTTEAEAGLQVTLAELELKMYQDPKSGTHKLEVEEINRLIDDINAEILAAEANLELAKKDKQAIESLFKQGYAGKSERDRSRLALLEAESKYAAQMNKLRTQLATLQKKETYERQMQVLTLDGKVATAKRTLAQVKRDNEALEDQAKAELDNANRTLTKEAERLKRYEKQLENCKIYAPGYGMIAYAVTDSKRFWLEEIRPGSPVRPRQHILSIPNLTKMQVRTSVHESVIDQVREGLPATIRIEAFPELSYTGKVKSVAVLADQQSPETKVYQTVVTIDGEVNQLKPGMTAIVEIHVDKVEKALSVPVQAIVQEGTESWCYVERGNNVERMKVELGATNHKFVEIKNGLAEGEKVVLNPMAILEESEESGDQPTDGIPEQRAGLTP